MARVTKTKGQQEYLLHPDKRGTMQLPVAINEGHIAKLDARLRSITTELLAQDEKKKALVAPINKRMAELREEQKNLVQQIKSGQTTADVVVEERANFESGEAWMIRKDTGDEVPDTRRALTPMERQAFTRGGADGELEPAAHRRVEERGEEELFEEQEGEELPEVDVPELRTSPFLHPVVAAPGEATLHLETPFANWSVRWPVVGLDLYFYQLGAPMGSAAWDAFGGEDGKGGWRRSGDTARVAAGALDATAAAIRAGTFKRPGQEGRTTSRLDTTPAESTAEQSSEGEQVLPLDNVRAGWSAVVAAGELFFRDEGGERVGPFRWSQEGSGLVRAPNSSVPEFWPDEAQDLLDAASVRVARGEVSVLQLHEEKLTPMPASEKDSTILYPLPAQEARGVDLSGWRFAVGQGKAMLRQPDGTLVGPFKWDSKRSVVDRIDDTTVTDAWWEKYEMDVLPAVDSLVSSGEVRDTFEGYTPTKRSSSQDRYEVTAQTGVTEETSELVAREDSATGEPAQGGDVELSPEDARATAETLTGYAPKVLLLLREKGPQHAPAIGREVQTAKPGAVINRLLKDGMIHSTTSGEALTKKGASVAAALEQIASQKRKK